jgi:hypothetical protein
MFEITVDNGFDHCAYYQVLPYEELCNIHQRQKISDCKDLIDKTGKEISVKTQHRFIEPHTGFTHLKEIRVEFSKNDFKALKYIPGFMHWLHRNYSMRRTPY